MSFTLEEAGGFEPQTPALRGPLGLAIRRRNPSTAHFLSQCYLAVRVGFEPTVPFARYSRFPSGCNRPLYQRTRYDPS
jgi:hypothetical protein